MRFTKEELFELTRSDGGRFKVFDFEAAYNFCRKLAIKHYENFPVASIFIPRKERKFIYSIYTFARISDDIADELTTVNKIERIDALYLFERNLMEVENIFWTDEAYYDFLPKFKALGYNPIIAALVYTMNEKSISLKPFQKLLSAFKKDIDFRQPETMNELFDYCSYSANPIGELVLRVFDLYNHLTIELSDKICTGLQLVNFWQDISIDIKNDRCYIPRDFLRKYNLNKDNLQNKNYSVNFSDCLDELCEFTENLLSDGKNLLNYLKPNRLRWEITGTILGGMIILRKLKKLKSGVLEHRPKLNFLDIITIIIKTLTQKI